MRTNRALVYPFLSGSCEVSIITSGIFSFLLDLVRLLEFRFAFKMLFAAQGDIYISPGLPFS